MIEQIIAFLKLLFSHFRQKIPQNVGNFFDNLIGNVTDQFRQNAFLGIIISKILLIKQDIFN